MQLEEIKGTSKKTGNPFTGYVIRIGDFQTPMFFPSKIELMYIKNRLSHDSHDDFLNDLNDDFKDM